MADNKKYYWLKLKSDFFDDDTISFLEEQENGKDYVIFYLKLCLKSLKDDGKLIRVVGNTLIPYDINSLSKLTNTNQDTVRVAMNLFKQFGLVDVLDGGEIYISQIKEMIGSETSSAERVRRHRLLKENEKALQCNTNVTPMLQNCNTEIEKEIELEKDIDKEIELDIEPSVNALAPIIELPLNDNTLFPITQEQFNEYKNAYQNVDVMNELQKMKVWLNSNPTKRKTKKGILRFVNSWLAKEQDKPKVNYQKPVERVQPVYHQEQQTSVNREELLKSIKESLARM